MDDLIERLEAERDRMWTECRLLTRRTYTTATPDMLGQAAAELRTLRAELERRKYDTMHTCHAECQREACVLRREVDALRAQLAEARESERAAVVKWLRTNWGDGGRADLSREVDALRTELLSWQRLHAENCENYDRVCAEREWLHKRATEADEIIASLRSKIVRLERTQAVSDLIDANLVYGTLGDSDGDDGA